MQERDEKRALFLVGMMACGKSTVGKALAQRLGWTFFDVDREIEKRSGVPVSEIFEREGEAGFRKREHKMMQELTEMPHVVVAMGGGAPMQAMNRPLLKRGLVIQLVTTVSEIVERTRFDTARPLLQGPDKEQRIEALCKERAAIYDEVSDVKFSTSRAHPNVVVDEILASEVVKRIVGL